MPKQKLPAASRRVKLSVTLSPLALKKLDEYARRHRLTRSAALAAIVERSESKAPESESE